MTETATETLGTTWRLLFDEAGGDPLAACKGAPPLVEAISKAAKDFPSACWDDVESGCRRAPRAARPLS